jgi:glycosyltransferase involved in cell wall biosynthesis
VEWLADAGHACHVLTTARFEARVAFTIEEHLRARGVEIPRASKKPGRSRPVPVAHYQVRDVPVTLLVTRHNDEARPNRDEGEQFLRRFDRLLDEFAPDVLIACNGHPMIFAAMESARDRGIVTAFAVRGFGYYAPRYFEHVDYAFTCSQFLTDMYRDKVGLTSTPLEPPIDWSATVAPPDSRAFVTFVHPAPHKGLWLFARLADMLGSRRPDIPILVVQSGHSAGALNAIPEIDFGKYQQIMAAPAVPTPAEYFALTRLLLVPSVWEEPFGRVAAEAMINGVPPLVSERGSLPHVVGGDFASGGGGCVLPMPSWMTEQTTRLPSEQEVEPWYTAVCALWDDPGRYHAMSSRAREIAHERYSELVSRRRHVDYFTSLVPGARALAVAR